MNLSALKSACLPLVSLTLLAVGPNIGAAPGPVLRVADFGAVPNDGKDDTPALNRAFDACARQQASRLVFAPGRYDLCGDPNRPAAPRATARGLRGITVEGNGAELICHGAGEGIVWQNCRDLVIRDLTIDWATRLHTAGRVIALGQNSFDLEVAPGYDAAPGSNVCLLWEYDGANRRPLRRNFSRVYLLKQPKGPKTAVATPGVLRITLGPQAVAVHPGQGKNGLPQLGAELLVFHFERSAPTFRLLESSNCRLENVSIYAGPGMAFAATLSENITLKKFSVRPRPDSKKWISSRADGLHFISCRGRVVLEDCRIENTGDDAFCVHGMYGKVIRRLPSGELEIAQGRPGRVVPALGPDLKAGDRIEFGWGANPLQPAASGRIHSVTTRNGISLVRCETPPPPEVTPGTVVNNVETMPALEIRRCLMRNIMACGARIKTRNALVENSRFEYCFAYGMLVICDHDKWWESGAVRDLRVSNNTFIACGAGNAPEGAIKITAGRQKSYPRVHRRLYFSGNLIDADHLTRGAIVLSAEDMTWTGNTFKNTLGEAMYLDCGPGIVLRDNRQTGSGHPFYRTGPNPPVNGLTVSGTVIRPEKP